jgi:hypothetical protein
MNQNQNQVQNQNQIQNPKQNDRQVKTFQIVENEIFIYVVIFPFETY